MNNLDKYDKHKYDFLEYEKEKYSYDGKQYYCAGCDTYPAELITKENGTVLFYCVTCQEAKYLSTPEEYEKLHGENPKDF